MKKTLTSLSFSASWMTGKSMLVIFFLAFFMATGFSQDIGAQMEIGDLSDIHWKSQADLNTTFAQEQTKTDVALTQPGLSLSDRALLLSYQRLLNYVQDGVQAGNELDLVLPKSYEKVVAEAPLDLDLKHLNTDIFITLIPGLVEALSEVPVPAVGQ